MTAFFLARLRGVSRGGRGGGEDQRVGSVLSCSSLLAKADDQRAKQRKSRADLIDKGRLASRWIHSRPLELEERDELRVSTDVGRVTKPINTTPDARLTFPPRSWRRPPLRHRHLLTKPPHHPDTQSAKV